MLTICMFCTLLLRIPVRLNCLYHCIAGNHNLSIYLRVTLNVESFTSWICKFSKLAHTFTLQKMVMTFRKDLQTWPTKKSLCGFPTAAIPPQLYKLEKINLMQTNQVLITEQRL